MEHGGVAAQERSARRRLRLAQELTDENVKLVTDLALRGMDPLTPEEAAELEQVLLDELTYARYPPVHERRQPSYGCLIVPGEELPVDLPNDLYTTQLADKRTAEVARELADGLHTFVLRTASRCDARGGPGQRQSGASQPRSR